MEIRLLGPVELVVDGASVPVAGTKLRAVLAMLALDANRPVSADRLMEGLWGEELPASAGKMVQHYVWQLRRLMPADHGAEVVTRGRGYELRVDPERVDVLRVERLVADATEAGVSGAAAREALGLWRAPPLADVADQPFAAVEIGRLEELRLDAAELAFESELAAGREREVLGDIEALAAECPLRERLHAQRMLALYRCERQAEALEAYREARAALVEQFGVEPGPELQRLQQAVLRQDPELELEPRAPELPLELDRTLAAPLVGRDAELAPLRVRLVRARGGAGSLVTLVGSRGMGKTRLAAELATDAARLGATVVYGSGVRGGEQAVAAVGAARKPRRPTLVVIDDADRAGAEVLAALTELAGTVATARVLVLATGQDAALLGRLGALESLMLAPLDRDAVREIALLYASDELAASVPVEELVAASLGVPRRVHRVSADWARREGARRVEAVAGDAATGRGRLRSIEGELSGRVVSLQRVRERADLFAVGDSVLPQRELCPFKGLAAFDVDDAAYFFGRERLVAELVARLVGAPLLAVVGPSGSGKSSVLRAGLLPALSAGVLPGAERWAQAVIRPGSHPLQELERARGRLADGRRGLLAVDQFEETFAAGVDDGERGAFLDALVDAACDSERRLTLILAIRSDFYGRCAGHPEFADLLEASHVLVGPMGRDELRRAIERPAQRVGVRVEPELTDALVVDVGGEPGGLPLLSTALLELWEHRQGHRLSLAAYEHRGGVRGAVARLAEDTYARLGLEQQAVARGVLLRLVDRDEGGSVLRRRIAKSELGVKRSEDVQRVIEELTRRRLLTVSEGAVELAHEALAREWPRLRAWLDQDADGRRLHRHLHAAAREWDAANRDRGELYRGARLASALEWSATRAGELDDVEREFLAAGRAASERAQRRLRLGFAGVGALLVIAVIAGFVALNQRSQAREEAVAAEAQRLGAQALLEDDWDRSLLLARQGVALDDTPQTRGNLLAALIRSPAAIGVLPGTGNRLLALDLSPDGRTLAIADQQGLLALYDTATRRPLGIAYRAPGRAPIFNLRFSPDGSRLVVVGPGPRGITAQLLDARTRTRLSTLDVPANGAPGPVAFSPDGRIIAIGYTFGAPPTPGPSYVARFDARSGRRLAAPRAVNRGGEGALAYTADGSGLITSDPHSAILRDARTLRRLRRVARVGSPLTSTSPDDRTLLVGGADGSVHFVDLRSRRERIASGRHNGAALRADFAPDGRRAITAGADGTLIVWNVATAAPEETFKGHAGRIHGLAISPDGRTAYSAGLDGRIFIWDLAGDRRLGRPFQAGAGDTQRPQFALSPDGRQMAIGQDDGAVSLVDMRTLARSKTIPVVPRGQVLGIGFVPHSHLLVVVGQSGFLALVDVQRGTVTTRLAGHRGAIYTPSVSADGRLLATASDDRTVRLWTLPDGRPLGDPLRLRRFVDDVSLSPDGRRLAVTQDEKLIEILDARTRQRQTTLIWDEGLEFARFSPNGRQLVGGGIQGRVRLWDTTTWTPVGRPLGRHAGPVLTADISRDGSMLATASFDATARLWDLTTYEALGAPLPGQPDHPAAARFTPDGTHLIAAYDTGRAYRWDVRPAIWKRRACTLAGRRLTRSEWSELLPRQRYEPTC